MGNSTIIFVLLLALLSTTPSFAVLDCAFLLENHTRLTELKVLFNKVEESAKTSSVVSGFTYNVKKELENLGIPCAEYENKIYFKDQPFDGKPIHQITRIAKYLVERGVILQWDPLFKNNGSLSHQEDDGHPDYLFRRKATRLTVSTKTLVRMIRLNRESDPVVRHELLHLQTLINVSRGTQGIFYGQIVNPNEPDIAYRRYMSLDEIPASLESILGANSAFKRFASLDETRAIALWDKKTPNEDEKYSYRYNLEHYRRLHWQVKTALEDHELLLEQGRQDQWRLPELKRTQYGTFIDRLTLKNGDTFSLILGNRQTLTNDQVESEISGRVKFLKYLLDEISDLQTPRGQYLLDKKFDAKQIKFSDSEWLKTLREIDAKQPTLKSMISKMWAVRE